MDDAASVDEATRRFKLDDFNLIISDLRLPGAPGTDLIELAKSVPVLIMTSYASLRSAVDAMKLGAVDYIAKPFDHDEMLLAVRSILDGKTNNPVQANTLQTNTNAGQTHILGSCAAMQELAKRITKSHAPMQPYSFKANLAPVKSSPHAQSMSKATAHIYP